MRPNFQRTQTLIGICSLCFTAAYCPPCCFAQRMVQSSQPQINGSRIDESQIMQPQYNRRKDLLSPSTTAQRLFSTYLRLGNNELREGRTFVSIREYRRAEKLRPHSATIHRLLAIDYFLLDQRALFGKEMRLALIDDPKNEQSYYIAGRFAFEVEQHFQMAATYFSKAIDLNPRDYKAHYYLGLSDKKLNKITESEAEFKRACELVQSSHTTYDLPFRDMARLCLEKRENRLALKYSNEASVLDPKGAANYFVRGEAEFAMGNLHRAVDSLKRSALLDPTYARPYYVLGNIYRRIGKPALAKKAFKKFEDIKREYDGI